MNQTQEKQKKNILSFIPRYLEKHFDSEVMSYKKVLNIYIPLLIDQAFLIIMALLNSSMVSSSGAEAVSAVSMVDSLNFFLTNLFIAIATGGTVVVAQYIGKGDTKKASQTISQAVTSSVLIAVVVAAIIIVFSNQTLGILFGKADQKILDNALIYLIGSCLSYPFYAVLQASSGALRGSGDTKASMAMSVGMNILYLIGNVVMVQFMDMGVLGVSISMVFSRVVVSIAALGYLLVIRKDLCIKLRDFFKLNLGIQKSILYIGVPAGTEQIFFNGGKILTQTFIVSLGTVSITANAIGNTLLNLWQIPMFAISMCAVTIVGQCVGAGRPDVARKYLKSMNKTSNIVTAFMMAVLMPFIPLYLKMFNASPEVGKQTTILLLIPILGLITTWAPSFITPQALRAAGDATFTTVASLISMWSVRVTLGYILAIPVGWGIYGVWIAMVIEWCSRTLVFTLRFRGSKWEKHKVIS